MKEHIEKLHWETRAEIEPKPWRKQSFERRSETLSYAVTRIPGELGGAYF